MILSDLLHFSDSHDVLISSILGLSSKDKNAKVFIGVRRDHDIVLHTADSVGRRGSIHTFTPATIF